MIAIIDYGVGNLGSIANMLNKIGVAFAITSRPEDIQKANKIILPGVGAFDFAMEKLNATSIPEVIKEKAIKGIPILGICLGAQLLTEGSEEGKLKGIGLFNAHCIKFNGSQMNSLKVPHMGWSEIDVKFSHPVMQFEGFEEAPRFYFAHSYHMVTSNESILCSAEYGYSFASILAKNSIVAAQFHPEKSHFFGMRFFKNFNNWNP